MLMEDGGRMSMGGGKEGVEKSEVEDGERSKEVKERGGGLKIQK